MAKIVRRDWTSRGTLGKRVRHTAFGYMLTVNGQRERKFSSAWTSEEPALAALSERQQQIRAGQTDRSTRRSAWWRRDTPHVQGGSRQAIAGGRQGDH